MTDKTLRTAIARAISPDWWSDGIAVENREVKQEISLEQADAVLKVLADLPETVIERAAEGLHDAAFGQELPEAPIDLARAAFRAAFGGEQT